MKEIATTLGGALGKVSAGEDVFAKVKSSDLSVEQKQAIKYFFARLSRVYQAEYRRQIPDESSERACKAEFGDRIANINKETMDKGFDSLHNELCSIESDYRFMRLDSVIELIKTGGNAKGCQDGAYRVFAPALPISDDMKASRKAAAEKGCQKLMSMFEDEE